MSRPNKTHIYGSGNDIIEYIKKHRQPISQKQDAPTFGYPKRWRMIIKDQ